MPSNEATPFTIRDQLEHDARRAIDAALLAALKHYHPQYKPQAPWPADLHVSRCANNKVGLLTVRVRVEIAGNAVEAEWLDERG